MFVLVLRLGHYMIVQGDELKQMALRQQTSDQVVTAVRGSILDRSGNQLAISATTNTIWVRPEKIGSVGKTEADHKYNLDQSIHTLAQILEMEEDDVRATATSEKKLIKLAKNVDKEKAALIRDAAISGIEITEDAKRYYPLGSFASQILGTTSDDNTGLTGLESYYNRYLAGLNGRWITSKDNKSNALSYGTDKYYSAEDGYSLYLTIDENIQYIVEDAIAAGLENTQAQRVACICLDPQTGEILAMAQTDEYDPNNPREPQEKDAERFSQMTSEEQVAYWNKMWRSFCISDTYEPGSTFKLITTSLALDTGVTNMNEVFYCPGYAKVADWTIHCWNYPAAHGSQDLTKAVMNSCNVTMLTLAQRMGVTKFFDGLEAFGLTKKTGVDYPGEGSNLLYSRSSVGIVELSTMSYGQGIAVTPINMITALASIGNDGKVMQPHFLKEIRTADGELVEAFEPVVKSVSISKQTASDVCSIMERYVAEGSSGSLRIPGYRIGGKTGTASKPEGGGYSKTDVICSFVGMAPIDDPKIICLVIVDSPRKGKYGNTTAGPVVKQIIKKTMEYMDIQPEYTDAEKKQMASKYTTVPDVTGQPVDDAIGILAGRELEYALSPEIEEYLEITVSDQFPKPGEEVLKGTKVVLYYETN